MNSKQKIAVGVFAALFFIVTKVRNVIRRLGFKLVDISTVSVNTENNTSDVRISLLLNNSLPFGVTVDAIAGDLYLQGVQVATIDQPLNVYIQPSSVTPVYLYATINWVGIAQGVRNNIMSGNIRTLNLQLIGTVTAEGRAIQINKMFTYYDFAK